MYICVLLFTILIKKTKVIYLQDYSDILRGVITWLWEYLIYCIV